MSKKNVNYSRPLPVRLLNEQEFVLNEDRGASIRGSNRRNFAGSKNNNYWPIITVARGIFSSFANTISYGWSVLRNAYYWQDSPIDVSLDEGIFKVAVCASDPKSCDALKLWRFGYFGKGILSRSEPTWYQRTEHRLHLKPYSEKDLVSEEITALRREERKKFKSLREDHQAEILKIETKISKLMGQDTFDLREMKNLKLELDKLNQVSLRVDDFKQFKLNNKIELYPASQLTESDSRLSKNGVLAQLEYMQLSPHEVIFLLIIGSIRVQQAVQRTSEENSDDSFATFDIKQVLHVAVGDSAVVSNSPFLLEYVVYHYYRSKGRCVRSGIKFGVDFILYDQGPPISHAQHCVKIVDGSLKISEYSAVGRVVGGVKKTLVLAYVSCPSQSDFQEAWKEADSPLGFLSLLSLYKVTEVVYGRWVASRNR